MTRDRHFILKCHLNRELNYLCDEFAKLQAEGLSNKDPLIKEMRKRIDANNKEFMKHSNQLFILSMLG